MNIYGHEQAYRLGKYNRIDIFCRFWGVGRLFGGEAEPFAVAEEGDDGVGGVE